MPMDLETVARKSWTKKQCQSDVPDLILDRAYSAGTAAGLYNGEANVKLHCKAYMYKNWQRIN
jgi:hypothetical protein